MYLPQKPLSAAIRGARAVVRPTAPMLTQMVVIRRCNLACGYCNEYDDHSPPVPTDELLRRVDHLADLGTVVLTLTGGEPLLHPDLHHVVAHATARGMVCTTISNAYPFTQRWIERLNRARLSWLQVSIDNLEPNDVSQKSWSKVKKRLLLLKEHAEFGVNINAVLGSCPPEDTRRLVDEVRELGFYMTVGVMHDDKGQLDRGLAGDELASLYTEIRKGSRRTIFHSAGEGWEEQMIATGKAPYKCRAGGRYLYVDEFGKVSYCSQRRGEPGIPLLEYGQEQLREGFDTQKGCEQSCTIACVRRASSQDGWRAQPRLAAPPTPPASREGVRLPVVQG